MNDMNLENSFQQNLFNSNFDDHSINSFQNFILHSEENFALERTENKLQESEKLIKDLLDQEHKNSSNSTTISKKQQKRNPYLIRNKDFKEKAINLIIKEGEKPKDVSMYD